MEKYKAIYENYPAYKSLSKKSKELFDLLFQSIYLDETITYTNQHLAETLKEGLSSIEKHMKELRDNQLITCVTSKYLHYNRWKTTRVISFHRRFIDKLRLDLHDIYDKKEEDKCLF